MEDDYKFLILGIINCLESILVIMVNEIINIYVGIEIGVVVIKIFVV